MPLRPDGGMDVTWKLRPGVTWHDGTPLTSADVKFTVDAINDPGYNPESTDGFDRIASVDTPDPLTAIVHYKEVYAPYALQFMRGLFPKHVLQGRDIDRAADYNRAPLGTGPYRVAEWKSGEYIRLERVPNYWRGSEYPHIKQILFRFVAEHEHADQPAQERRGAPGRDVPMGQASRGGGHSGRDRPPHAGQRLRARHAEPAPRGGLPRGSRCGARCCTPSIATRSPPPSWTGWRRSRTAPFSRSRGHSRRGRPPTRSMPRGAKRCSTRPAGATATATASGRRTGSRCDSRSSPRLVLPSARASRRCCSGNSGTSAWTWPCSSWTARASAGCGSKGTSTRCCTGGRCRPILSSRCSSPPIACRRAAATSITSRIAR